MVCLGLHQSMSQVDCRQLKFIRIGDQFSTTTHSKKEKTKDLIIFNSFLRFPYNCKPRIRILSLLNRFQLQSQTFIWSPPSDLVMMRNMSHVCLVPYNISVIFNVSFDLQGPQGYNCLHPHHSSKKKQNNINEKAYKLYLFQF